MQDKQARLIEKIRAMMERTTANGCTEAEAMTAAAMAHKLMEQAGLTPEDIAAGQSEASDTHWTRTDFDHPIQTVGGAIARFTGTRIYCNAFTEVVEQHDLFGTASRTQKQFRWLRIVGLDHEIQIAGYLFDICYNAMETAAAKALAEENNERAAAKEPLLYGNERKQWVRDFQIGMGSRMAQTLRDMTPPADTRSQVGKGDGRSLVAVRSDLINKWFEDRGIHLTTKRGPSVRNNSGYAAGQRAGANVGFNSGVGQSGGQRMIGGR